MKPPIEYDCEIDRVLRGSMVPTCSGCTGYGRIADRNMLSRGGRGAVKMRIIFRVGVVVLLAVLVCFLCLEMRGGFYPSYSSATFSNLTPPGVGGHAAGDLVAQTEAGALRGSFVGRTAVFMGIPYAHPPVGALRWEAPQPPMPWTGARDATRPGSACVQGPAGLTGFFAPMAKTYGSSWAETVQSSEDWLYLNVWAPEWPPKPAPPGDGLATRGQQPGGKRGAVNL